LGAGGLIAAGLLGVLPGLSRDPQQGLELSPLASVLAQLLGDFADRFV
jgi:hypothetical protein